MPRLIQPEGRTETVVDAMSYILAGLGPAGLTLRTIARESRVSTSSLPHHFHSREKLLRIGARWTGRARLAEIERRSTEEGIGAFLPGDDDAEDLIRRSVAGVVRTVAVHRVARDDRAVCAPVRPLTPAPARDLLSDQATRFVERSTAGDTEVG